METFRSLCPIAIWRRRIGDIAVRVAGFQFRGGKNRERGLQTAVNRAGQVQPSDSVCEHIRPTPTSRCQYGGRRGNEEMPSLGFRFFSATPAVGAGFDQE